MRHAPGRSAPPWWPKDEPFPPRDFRSEQWRRVGRGFFLRTAILFAVLFVVGVALGTAFVWWLAVQLDWLPLAPIIARPPPLVQVPPAPRLPVPGPGGPRAFLPLFFVGPMIFAAGAWVVLRATRALRRATEPMRGLIDAASQVQAGDYTARVPVPSQAPEEARALATAFNDMTARLQQNERARRNLLADVTHELRTPLTIIQGNIEGVLDGVYERDDAHLAPILEEVQVMSRLIEDLRTLALAESGNLKLQREATDMVALITHCLASFEPQAAQAGMHLRAVFDGSESAQGAGSIISDVDPVRMREVLNNLVSNALRYTAAGEQVVVSMAHRNGADDSSIEISVRDTGSGIAPELLPHIFDRFAKDRESRGSGLGLAIARQLVEAHGGSISARSSFDVGTTVTIVLPA